MATLNAKWRKWGIPYGELWLCALITGMFVLAGCAAPSAGGEARAIHIENSPYASITINGDGNGTATAAPETGEQSASATVSPEVDVPAIP